VLSSIDIARAIAKVGFDLEAADHVGTGH
jgi:hypothetical protein